MKQQPVNKPGHKSGPVITNERKHKLSNPPVVDDSKLVRTVLYVEVRDMDTQRVQMLMQQINEVYEGARGGIHYVLPVRNGKIGSDIVFESEFLATVKETCEIKDGEIVLKGGAKDVLIIREKVED